MLGEAERPLIYAGGGVINGEAAEELRASRIEFDIPVVTTLMGIGAFDTTDPLSMRMLGMHGTAFANYAVDDCDFLVCARRTLRRPRGRRAGEVRAQREAHRALRHRCVGDQQGQARAVEPRRAAAAGARRSCACAGRRTGFERDWSPWHAHSPS